MSFTLTPLTILVPMMKDLSPYLIISCTNCFLALSVELFLYLFAGYGRFFGTILLQLAVFLYLINALDLHMAAHYNKSLALQSDSSSSTKNLLFRSVGFSSVSFLLMCFVLGNGSSHSLLAWNAFRFTVQLFMMMLLL